MMIAFILSVVAPFFNEPPNNFSLNSHNGSTFNELFYPIKLFREGGVNLPPLF
jgi:hypothetical protein